MSGVKRLSTPLIACRCDEVLTHSESLCCAERTPGRREPQYHAV